MATLPTPDPTWIPMTVEELFAIRGTPEFEVEYRRQLSAVAMHDRRAGGEERMATDWEFLEKSWK